MRGDKADVMKPFAESILDNAVTLSSSDLPVSRRSFFALMGATAAVVSLSSCGTSRAPGGQPPMVSLPPSNVPLISRSSRQLKKEVNVVQDLVASGHYCRWKTKSMTPRYVTIHTTQNRSAGAWQHSQALKNGRIRGGNIGYLSWHYTVDQDVAIQHLPHSETAHHCEYHDGPGNLYSIGIEMCEHRGNSMVKTYDRTAKLTAILMKEYDIPLRNVVGHVFWTGKDCPKPLLTNGRPGFKWAWFLSRIDYYYRCINGGSSYLDF